MTVFQAACLSPTTGLRTTECVTANSVAEAVTELSSRGLEALDCRPIAAAPAPMSGPGASLLARPPCYAARYLAFGWVFILIGGALMVWLGVRFGTSPLVKQLDFEGFVFGVLGALSPGACFVGGGLALTAWGHLLESLHAWGSVLASQRA